MAFQTVSGVVIDGDIWSETRVIGGGGGIAMGGIAIGSSNARSQVTTQAQYWIRTEDGRDIAVLMDASCLAVRVGHRVSALIEPATSGAAKVWCAFNWDTGQRTRSTVGWLWFVAALYTIPLAGVLGLVGVCVAIDYSGAFGSVIVVSTALVCLGLLSSTRKTCAAMRKFWAGVDGSSAAPPCAHQPAAA